MYSGIQSTQGYLTDRTPKLCDTFAPHRSTRSTKLALDLVNLGISLFLSPYWNKGMFNRAIALFNIICRCVHQNNLSISLEGSCEESEVGR